MSYRSRISQDFAEAWSELNRLTDQDDAILGRMFRAYMSDSAHSDFEGYSDQELATVAALIRDMNGNISKGLLG